MTTDQDYEISRDTMLGVPITGDYTEGVNWGPQLTDVEFAALLQPVLDHPEMVKFGWHQYTPYFNDGDTCDFTTYKPWFVTRADEVKLDGNIDDIDDYNYEVGSSYSPHPTLGYIVGDSDYDGKTRQWKPNPRAGEYVGENRELYDLCVKLSDAIEGTSCYRVLLDAFGDHAEVTFSRDADTGQWRAHREFYSHD